MARIRSAKRRGFASYQQKRFLLAENLLASARRDRSDSPFPVYGKHEVIVSIRKVFSRARDPHRRRRGFAQLQPGKRQGCDACVKRDVPGRLEVSAEHDMSIMFAPIRNPVRFRQEIGRKFNNADARVCHDVMPMIQEAVPDRVLLPMVPHRVHRSADTVPDRYYSNCIANSIHSGPFSAHAGCRKGINASAPRLSSKSAALRRGWPIAMAAVRGPAVPSTPTVFGSPRRCVLRRAPKTSPRSKKPKQVSGNIATNAVDIS